MKIFLFCLVVAFMFGNVTAQTVLGECDWLADAGYCSDVSSDSNLSDFERHELVFDFFREFDSSHVHKSVEEFNSKLDLSNNDFPKQNGYVNAVHDTWLRVVGVYPSFWDDNSLEWIVSDSGRAVIDFDYAFSMPHGPLPGECKTDLWFVNQSHELENFVNGNFVSDEKEFDFSLGDGNFSLESRLRIYALIGVRHYYQTEVCWNDHHGGHCAWRCVFSHEEVKDFGLEIKRQFNGVQREPVIDYFLRVDDSNGLDFVELDVNRLENVTGFLFDFGEGSIQLNGVYLDTNYLDSVPEILHAELRDENNLVVRGFVNDCNSCFCFNLTDFNYCKLFLDDGFSVFEQDCDVFFKKDVFVNLFVPEFVDSNSVFDFNVHLVDGLNVPVVDGNVLVSVGGRKFDCVTDLNGECNFVFDGNLFRGNILAEFEGTDFLKPGSDFVAVPYGNPDLFWDLLGMGVWIGAMVFPFWVVKRRFEWLN